MRKLPDHLSEGTDFPSEHVLDRVDDAGLLHDSGGQGAAGEFIANEMPQERGIELTGADLTGIMFAHLDQVLRRK